MVLGGQSFFTPDALVKELRQLVDDQVKDISASGDDYERVKRLLEDSKMLKAKASKAEVARKANVGASYLKAEVDGKLALKADKATTYIRTELYTQTEADGKFASFTDMSTAKRDISRLKSGKADVTALDAYLTKMDASNTYALETDLSDLETAVGAEVDTASASGSLYARVAKNKADLSVKASASDLATLNDRVSAASVGIKPLSGTESTLWEEVQLKANKTDLSVKANADDVLR